MKAFVLAGGFATRLWPLTEKRAKPLLPLAGIPLLTHITEKIPTNIPIVISTNAVFGEEFMKWKNEQKRSDITIIIEDTLHDDKKLGALGSVASWVEHKKIDEDVLLLTGDNFFGFSINYFLKSARPSIPLLATHYMKTLDQAKAFGTVILEEDGKSIQSFEEKPNNPKTTLVSTGCSLLPAEVLPVLIEYSKTHSDNIGGIFEELLQRNITIDCFRFEEPWFDIGSFEAYLEATKMLVGNNTIKTCEEDVKNCILKESNVIGKNSTVKDSTLQNVVIFDNCEIEDCILEDCIIDNYCNLKGIDITGKMIRENTKLQVNE